MAERDKKMGRTHRIDQKELENWLSQFQTLVIRQLNSGYTGQVVLSIKNGQIENIRNLEIIGTSTLEIS